MAEGQNDQTMKAEAMSTQHKKNSARKPARAWIAVLVIMISFLTLLHNFVNNKNQQMYRVRDSERQKGYKIYSGVPIPKELLDRILNHGWAGINEKTGTRLSQFIDFKWKYFCAFESSIYPRFHLERHFGITGVDISTTVFSQEYTLVFLSEGKNILAVYDFVDKETYMSPSGTKACGGNDHINLYVGKHRTGRKEIVIMFNGEQ